MKKIVVYGEFGKKFGKYWRLEVKTPAEAIRAMCSNNPRIRHYLAECNRLGVRFRVFCGRDELGHGQMVNPFSEREVIRIVPFVTGAGRDLKNALTFVVGVALIVFAPASAPWLSQIGWGLATSGAIGLLVKPPSQVGPQEAPENQPNFFFQGAVNTVLQGGCVPVLYGGPLIVGSQVISAGITSVEQGTKYNNLIEAEGKRGVYGRAASRIVLTSQEQVVL